jgi:hypothetical protein
MHQGWEATIYGEPVKELCQQMKEVAIKALRERGEVYV